MVALIIRFLLFSRTFKALSAFNKRNIIIFLEKFKLIYDNIEIKAKIKAKRISEYYENNIARELKRFNK